MNRLLSYWVIILLTSLYGCTSKTVDKDAQARNDSIQKYLDLAGNDNMSYGKRKGYNNKAYSMINMNMNDTVSISSLYKTTMNFHRFNQLKELKFNSALMLKKALLLKDDYWISLSYKVLGLYYMNNSENEKALYYFFKAKKHLFQLSEHKEIMSLLFNISLTQYYAGDLLGSNKTAFEVLKIQKKYRSNIPYGVILNQIGNNLGGLKQDNKAIEYYLKINRKRCNLKMKNIIANNISTSYIEIGEYKKAYNELDSIIKNKDFKEINPSNYATAVSLLGYSKLKMNNLKELPKVFFIADNIYKNSKTINGSNYNQMYLSMYYEKINDTANAIRAAKKALFLSKSYNNPSDILVTLEQLIKVDKKNASTNAQEYIRVNNSLQISERNFRDKFARIAYETEEITQEKDKAVNQKWIVATIATVIVLFVLLILIITRQQSKQKELQLLQEQQKANEEIYDLMLNQKRKEEEARQSEKKRIAIELHDGVMNRLASTRLNLNMLSYQKDKETINKCLIHVQEIYKIEQEIRNIAHNLNLDVFKESNSFVVILNEFIITQNTTTSSQYILEISKNIDWNHISSGIKMNLYRIIQEASHNINKYARASNVIISLALNKNNICLCITDNGKGFDTNVNFAGIGLNNINHRVKSLKGEVFIESNTISTSINITIPFTI
ncbi:tetratricopeptide repeat-containing sensor histidine kinase [Flavobacterium sangjuense]|nr:ATP-binding protein [Flavobacterium sangjuense]